MFSNCFKYLLSGSRNDNNITLANILSIDKTFLRKYFRLQKIYLSIDMKIILFKLLFFCCILQDATSTCLNN